MAEGGLLRESWETCFVELVYHWVRLDRNCSDYSPGVHIAPRDAVAGSEPREVEAMIDDQTLFTAQQGVDDFPNRSRGVCLSNETHLVNEMDPWNQIFPFDIHTGILLSMGPAAV